MLLSKMIICWLFCTPGAAGPPEIYGTRVGALPDGVLPYLAYADETLVVPIDGRQFADIGAGTRYAICDVQNVAVVSGILEPVAGSGAWLLLHLRGLTEGFYTVRVFDGDHDSKRPNAFARIAVLPRPAAVDPVRSPFGLDCFVNFRLPQDEGKIRLLCRAVRKAGVHWVRDRLVWGRIQPKPGVWRPEPFATNFHIQAEEGLKVLAVFHDTAPWASQLQSGDAEAVMHAPPADPLTLGRFLARCVGEFYSDVAAYEIWNEFDIPVFFTGTPDEYASCLKAAYNGIKAVQPAMPVILGSATMNAGSISWGGRIYRDERGADYVADVAACGAVDFCDALNVHYYGPASGYLAKVNRYRDLFGNRAQFRPLWITEVGLPATATPTAEVVDAERRQADFLEHVYTAARAWGDHKVFFFSGPNFLEHGQTPWGILHETDFGWEPKPAFFRLAQLTAAYAPTLYKQIPAASPDHARNIWTDIVSDVDALPPDQDRLNLRLRLFRQGLPHGDGTFRIEAAGHVKTLPFSLPKRAANPWCVDLSLPVSFPRVLLDLDAPPDAPRIVVAGALDGTSLPFSPTVRRLRWQPQVHLSCPLQESWPLETVRCAVRPATAQARAAVLELVSESKPGAPLAKADVPQLSTGDSVDVLLPLPPGGLRPDDTAWRLVWSPEHGIPHSRRMRVETNRIPGTVHYLEGVDRVVINTEMYHGDDDLQARFTATWSADRLTIVVRVRDETFRNCKPRERPWMGDCVELFLDLRSGKQFGGSAYTPGVVHLAIVPGVVIGETDVVFVCEPANGAKPGHVRTASQRTEDGYEVLAEVDVTALAKPLAPGRTIGLDVAVDDLDAGEWSHCQIVWRGTQANWLDPSHFARMQIVETN
jgi:hypothetical protein